MTGLTRQQELSQSPGETTSKHSRGEDECHCITASSDEKDEAERRGDMREALPSGAGWLPHHHHEVWAIAESPIICCAWD